MERTIRERLEGEARLIGREPERRILHSVLEADGPVVVFVHGIAGIGKSALVSAFARDVQSAGATVLRLDGRAIEPTERGFLAGLGAVVGREVTTPGDAATRLSALGQRVVLLIDTYEVLRPLDPWLRDTFLPALSDRVRIVLAGREPPLTGWRAALGPLFRALALGNLRREDAGTLLRQAGVEAADASRINRIARGHPLSLELAAAALRESPGIDPEGGTVTAVIEGLTELYLAGLDAPTRRALEAAAVVRRPTVSLLGAMLPETAPQDAFDRLRDLPFVEVGSDGLVLHDTVREIVAAFLRASDPDRSRRYRVSAWRQLRRELARASPQEMWRYTADLLFILENPIIREAFFPTSRHLYYVDAAQAADWPAIEEMARRHEPATSAAILTQWWRTLPGAFRIARAQSGEVVGCSVVSEPERLSAQLLHPDPVARRCREHLRRQPLPRGQRALLERFEIATGSADALAMVQAALVLDLKRMYMELRPELRRMYMVDREPVTPQSPWARLGFQPVPDGAVVLDGVTFHAAVLDFGPASVDGWLSRVVAAELQVEEDSVLDPLQRQLVLDGDRVDLTTLEFELLAYLYERRDRVVERSALLRDVWGYEYAGGSNVVDVLVRALRKKLGSRAALIVTVRGVGYRWSQTAPLEGTPWVDRPEHGGVSLPTAGDPVGGASPPALPGGHSGVSTPQRETG